ncbi:uncharacterized protein LOC104865145 [Fukomys damarensis]|uniref:uncharacterized protein LOC104865145 n=1 Tax=Fukomys damarensis TaxID=885580 RepID=UPI001455D777|nr:uncharacterized protein LOC104865145 [Fukomys damarensis]
MDAPSRWWKGDRVLRQIEGARQSGHWRRGRLGRRQGGQTGTADNADTWERSCVHFLASPAPLYSVAGDGTWGLLGLGRLSQSLSSCPCCSPSVRQPQACRHLRQTLRTINSGLHRGHRGMGWGGDSHCRCRLPIPPSFLGKSDRWRGRAGPIVQRSGPTSRKMDAFITMRIPEKRGPHSGGSGKGLRS